MPVERKGRGRKISCVLVCDVCGTKSRKYEVRSPAAPELDACVLAGGDGWGYTIGFFAMLAGHRVFCPSCARPWRRTYVVDGEHLEVVRADLHPEFGGKRRWELRRAGVSGVPDAKVYLPEVENREEALRVAARRLLGPDAVEEAEQPC